jgi:hypothetical protein
MRGDASTKESDHESRARAETALRDHLSCTLFANDAAGSLYAACNIVEHIKGAPAVQYAVLPCRCSQLWL